MFDLCLPNNQQVNKYKVRNAFNDATSVLTYDESGLVDYLAKYVAFEEAYAKVEQDAGYILLDNREDRSFRSGLSLAGWNPIGDPQAMAIEWVQMDYEYAQTVVSRCPGRLAFLARLELSPST